MYGNVIQGQIMDKIVKLRSKSTAEIEKKKTYISVILSFSKYALLNMSFQ